VTTAAYFKVIDKPSVEKLEVLMSVEAIISGEEAEKLNSSDRIMRRPLFQRNLGCCESKSGGIESPFP